MVLPGSTPQLAERMAFGCKWRILVASSLKKKNIFVKFVFFFRKKFRPHFAANPPNTTECAAPSLTVASMPTTAWGTMGM